MVLRRVYTTSKPTSTGKNRHGDTRSRTVHFGKPVRNSSRLLRGSRSAGRQPTGLLASKFFMAVSFSRERLDIPRLVIKTAMKTDKPILKISFTHERLTAIVFRSLFVVPFFSNFRMSPRLFSPDMDAMLREQYEDVWVKASGFTLHWLKSVQCWYSLPQGDECLQNFSACGPRRVLQNYM